MFSTEVHSWIELGQEGWKKFRLSLIHQEGFGIWTLSFPRAAIPMEWKSMLLKNVAPYFCQSILDDSSGFGR